jgi:hypothetical protein
MGKREGMFGIMGNKNNAAFALQKTLLHTEQMGGHPPVLR